MKKLKIMRLAVLIITVILEALPFSAVLRFSSGPGANDVIYETFSYFSIMPLGYGHPTIVTAVLTVLLILMVIISIYKNVGDKFYTAETVISWAAFLTSVLPVAFLTHDPLKYVLPGFIIAVLLCVNLIFCYFTIYNEKANNKKITVVLLAVLILSVVIFFFCFSADKSETDNQQVARETTPETATDVLINSTEHHEADSGVNANLWALKEGETVTEFKLNPHYRDLNFNNDDVIDDEDFELSGMSRKEFAEKLVENGNLGTIGEAEYLFRGEICIPCGKAIVRY